MYFLQTRWRNMVWAVGIASRQAGGAAGPALGYAQPETPASATGGPRYVLGETVPAHWRPFIPAHVPGSVRSIRLQRARLPGQAQQPLGAVLDVAAPYFVAEEEVPRAGRRITRGFQRARWIDGTTFLWLGPRHRRPRRRIERPRVRCGR